MGPEDNPADDVQPTKAEWEEAEYAAWQRGERPEFDEVEPESNTTEPATAGDCGHVADKYVICPDGWVCCQACYDALPLAPIPCPRFDNPLGDWEEQ